MSDLFLSLVFKTVLDKVQVGAPGPVVWLLNIEEKEIGETSMADRQRSEPALCSAHRGHSETERCACVYQCVFQLVCEAD